jgi:hypothetical protein
MVCAAVGALRCLNVREAYKFSSFERDDAVDGFVAKIESRRRDLAEISIAIDLSCGVRGSCFAYGRCVDRLIVTGGLDGR